MAPLRPRVARTLPRDAGSRASRTARRSQIEIVKRPARRPKTSAKRRKTLKRGASIRTGRRRSVGATRAKSCHHRSGCSTEQGECLEQRHPREAKPNPSGLRGDGIEKQTSLCADMGTQRMAEVVFFASGQDGKTELSDGETLIGHIETVGLALPARRWCRHDKGWRMVWPGGWLTKHAFCYMLRRPEERGEDAHRRFQRARGSEDALVTQPHFLQPAKCVRSPIRAAIFQSVVAHPSWRFPVTATMRHLPPRPSWQLGGQPPNNRAQVATAPQSRLR
jgi:hypothetical protein